MPKDDYQAYNKTSGKILLKLQDNSLVSIPQG